VYVKTRSIQWYNLCTRILRIGGVVGSGALGVKCKNVSPGVCRSGNAFFFTMNRRASVFDLLSRDEQVEIARVNDADCTLVPQSDDFCENTLLEVCQRCWFSSFYCFFPPSFHTHSHKWSSKRGVNPAVVWKGIFCECTASVGRWAMMGPLLGAYLLTIETVPGRFRTRVFLRQAVMFDE
jgi:hypothetical protein